MRLIIIQLQRQSLLIFGRFSSVKNYSPIHIFPLEDRRMTLASMHPMFQVSISFCHHSSPNLFGKSMFTYSTTCQVEVVVSASRSCIVKIARFIGIWKCLLECQDWSPTMFLRAKLLPLYFVIDSFWRGLHYD